MATEYKLSYTGAQIDEILKKAEGMKVPTKMSELENDSGYANKSELEAMTVMIDLSVNETHTNYSSEEIHDAYREGRTVIMNLDGMIGYLSRITPGGGIVQFTFNYENQKAVITIIGNQVTNEEVFGGESDQPPLILTLNSDGTAINESIEEAVQAFLYNTKNVFLNLDGFLVPVSGYGVDVGLVFDGREHEYFLWAIVGIDGKVTIVENILANAEDIPTKLSQLENDSGYVTEDSIPTDDHINELIDAKLGVIENGTY